MYANHKTSHVYEILERYRVGNFVPPPEAALDASDPYGKDPKRSAALVVIQQKPFNAETPRALLSYPTLPSSCFVILAE